MPGMMSVDIRRISVAIRELGEGGVWRIPGIGEMYHPTLGGFSPDWKPGEG